jgi:hypothetical protein
LPLLVLRRHPERSEGSLYLLLPLSSRCLAVAVAVAVAVAL